ncbi:MAG TPA: hypothetical protein VGK48_28370 [Terriglobia bacterium]|jgi:hypothetical protein
MLNLLLVLLLQTQTLAPGQKVVVGLEDGQEVTIQDPVFTGFIEGHSGEAVLTYREGSIHGEVPLKNVSRIEFRPYKKGRPFSLTVTLKNGQVLQVEAERRDYVSLRGSTDAGMVTIKQPDPLSGPVGLTTRQANRKKDLTIQYLEFPTS